MTVAAGDLDGLLERLVAPLRVKPGRAVRLPGDFDPGHKAAFVDQADAAGLLAHAIEELAKLQDRLAAQRTYALLVVLQAMDAAGKDGVVKHVMTGVNPQGVTVRSFKAPSPEELRHDYLWRHQKALPERGEIGIFNRSHYEEVLAVRVHADLLQRQDLPREEERSGFWKRRYRDINAWERYLVDNGVRITKLFLNVSREEQRQRLLARIDDKAKNWKFEASDLAERARWDDYQRAYSEMLSETSTKWAPWHVIPADHKWFSQLASAAAIVRELKAIDPQYPKVDAAHRRALQQARTRLTEEAASEG